MGTPREQLAHLLKQARIDAGFMTHGKLATAMTLSRSVVVKAESLNGPVPTDDTLVAWSKATGCDFPKLLELAQRCKNGTPEWFVEYLTAEAEATRIQLWELSVFPGLLQTENYARALGEPESAVDQRMQRKQVIGKAKITAILNYAVFDLDIGGPAVMAEQCGYVADLAEKHLIYLHVVPDTARVGLGGALTIATRNGHSTVSLTTTVRDITSTAPDLVDDALAGYDRILGAALPAVESVEFARRREAAWKERS